MIYNPAKNRIITRDDFMNEHKVTPFMWAEVKTIGGCTSDAVPGVRGVGEKTAIQYLNGTLNKASKKYTDILQADASGILDMYRTLVTLPYPGLPESEFECNDFSFQAARDTFVAYGMQSFLDQQTLSEWAGVLNDSF